MSRLTKLFILLSTLVLIPACTHNTRIQSNYDDSLRFGDYETYNFSSRTEIEDPDLSGELELYFSGAVEQQMLFRGLVKSDRPDILINITVDTEDVSAAPVNANNCPRCEDYYSRKLDYDYDGAGERPMCIYAAGSIKLEMVDSELNQTIWEGVSLVRLDEKDRGDRLLQCIAADVSTMFDKAHTYFVRNPRHPNNTHSGLRDPYGQAARFIRTSPRGDG